MTEKSPNLICVAVIAGAHGVHGAVKVKSYTGVPADFSTYGPLLNEAGEVVLTPKNPRPINNAFTMRSPEIKTREQATAMRGTLLYVPRDILPEIEEEDDFYYTDLVGLDVKSTDGKRVGKIRSVHNFGAGEMLEIEPGKSAENQSSFFHPFTKIAVPKIDIKAGRVVIHIEDTVMGRAPTSEPKDKDEDLDSEDLGSEGKDTYIVEPED